MPPVSTGPTAGPLAQRSIQQAMGTRRARSSSTGTARHGRRWRARARADPGCKGRSSRASAVPRHRAAFAVGYATDDTGAALTDVIEQWNGTSWTIVPGAATGQAFDQLTAVQCLSATNCWAIGNAGPVQQDSSFLPIFPGAVGDQGLIEHWDGSAWSVVPSVTEPAPNGGYLSGLACTSANNCWASGATTGATGTQAGILMEHWDGSILGRRVGLGARTPPHPASCLVSRA